MIGPATPLEDILEADWQRDVVKLAKTLGWRVYHTYNSRRSAHGFPDLVLVRDRVVYIELKREKTQPTVEQCAWLRALLDAGAEAYLARPSDLEALGAVLAYRGIPWISSAQIGLISGMWRERTERAVNRRANEAAA